MRHVPVRKTMLRLAAIPVWLALPAAAQPQGSLLATPSSGMASSGDQGGPFSPWSFQYRVSASSGIIRYAVVPPIWLTANPRLGTAGTDGVMIAFMLNERARKLSPGTYETRITFTNLTNGQGTTSRTASLSVHQSSRGYLLDDQGGHLLHKRDRLLAR